MKSIIREIYLGNRGVLETVKMSDEYWEIMNKVADLNDELWEVLSEAQRDKLSEMSLLTSGLEYENSIVHYVEGFKIGMLTALECLK